MSEATEGGESPVTFNSDVINDLDPEIVDSITKRKIRYMRNITDEKNSDYITWQATFETKSKEVSPFELNCSGKSAFKSLSTTLPVVWDRVFATIANTF